MTYRDITLQQKEALVQYAEMLRLGAQQHSFTIVTDIGAAEYACLHLTKTDAWKAVIKRYGTEAIQITYNGVLTTHITPTHP